MTSDDLLESATSAMRAITQKLVEVNSKTFNNVTESDLASLVACGASSSESRIRINIVHILGLLANNNNASHKLVEDISTFLCEAAARDVDLRVVAEALDKIFDIYAEDDTDPICEKVGLVTKLKQVVPGLKAKISMQKKSLSCEDYSLIMMAKTNLVRFIRYKEKRGLK
jgi:hypothetical protein